MATALGVPGQAAPREGARGAGRRGRQARQRDSSPHLRQNGLRERINPTCTLSQNGYGVGRAWASCGTGGGKRDRQEGETGKAAGFEPTSPPKRPARAYQPNLYLEPKWLRRWACLGKLRHGRGQEGPGGGGDTQGGGIPAHISAKTACESASAQLVS